MTRRVLADRGGRTGKEINMTDTIREGDYLKKTKLEELLGSKQRRISFIQGCLYSYFEERMKKQSLFDGGLKIAEITEYWARKITEEVDRI